MPSFMCPFLVLLGEFDVVCLVSEHYQGGMKEKYRVGQCSQPDPDPTQFQEKTFYIAAEEIEWDYTPSRHWERELKRLQREKYGGISVSGRAGVTLSFSIASSEGVRA